MSEFLIVTSAEAPVTLITAVPPFTVGFSNTQLSNSTSEVEETPTQEVFWKPKVESFTLTTEPEAPTDKVVQIASISQFSIV